MNQKLVKNERYVVLFADITQSMHIYQSLGDEAAKTLITDLQRTLSHVIESGGGIVQEIIGDEVMARFDDVDGAINCAGAIHDSTQLYGLDKPVSLQMRIGIHYGHAIIEDDRMFGDTVNIAARVASIAQGGQTITTEALVNNASERWRVVARRFDVARVKGVSEPLVIYDLPWQQDGLTTINPISESIPDGTLELSYASKTISIDMSADTAVASSGNAIKIGRAPTNDLVINAPSVSRLHATIDVIRDQFFVTDKSTNGTHIYFDNGESVYLRREQSPLWGSGRLALGATSTAPPNSAPEVSVQPHVIEYRCTHKPPEVV